MRDFSRLGAVVRRRGWMGGERFEGEVERGLPGHILIPAII